MANVSVEAEPAPADEELVACGQAQHAAGGVAEVGDGKVELLALRDVILRRQTQEHGRGEYVRTARDEPCAEGARTGVDCMQASK